MLSNRKRFRSAERPKGFPIALWKPSESSFFEGTLFRNFIEVAIQINFIEEDMRKVQRARVFDPLNSPWNMD